MKKGRSVFNLQKSLHFLLRYTECVPIPPRFPFICSPFLFSPQSWNLLTRTSMSFEFVNLRLTVIWIIGFFVRYFILLPGRTCILIVGVSIIIYRESCFKRSRISLAAAVVVVVVAVAERC